MAEEQRIILISINKSQHSEYAFKCEYPLCT